MNHPVTVAASDFTASSRHQSRTRRPAENTTARKRFRGASRRYLLSQQRPIPITPYLTNHTCDVNNNNNNNKVNGQHQENGPIPDESLLALEKWNLPAPILKHYRKKNITSLFPWQKECLDCEGVLTQARNLLYSAPTSAGKSMVADLLMYKTLLEYKKKVIVVLPFVSISLEKVQSMKQMLRTVGIQMDSFAGKCHPKGGLARVDVAVCTIEKANIMITRLIEEKKLSEIGLVIVDELHMLGDARRGYLLELLLTKLLYLSQHHRVQIVGMSATIPNLKAVANWLNAELYISHYRPVALSQRIVRNNEVFEVLEDKLDQGSEDFLKLGSHFDLSKSLGITADNAALLYYSIETVSQGHSALVFCPTRKSCEVMAKKIAQEIFEFGAQKKPISNARIKFLGQVLYEKTEQEKLMQVMMALRETAFGLNAELKSTLRFGVAFHHAGLSPEERMLIEQGFRNNIIRVLCCTTTLYAGVNLPVRRVLISSPVNFKGELLSVATYRQMIGRAGRAGIDTRGESMLFCKDNYEFTQARDHLIRGSMEAIESHLLPSLSQNASTKGSSESVVNTSESLKRAILEVIASDIVSSPDEVVTYIKCTFYHHCRDNEVAHKASFETIEKTVEQVMADLHKSKLIFAVKGNESALAISPLGKAIVASGISVDSGKFILDELTKSREQMCLANDLHLIYLVTPTYVINRLDVDWNRYWDLWPRLGETEKKIAERIGVRESFLYHRMMHPGQTSVSEQSKSEAQLIHERFYMSLVLNELVQEVPLAHVANKYGFKKDQILTLQEDSSSFSGMLSTFCEKLSHGWDMMALIFKQFQSRLAFGVHLDLIDLMRIPYLTSNLARNLHTRGFTSLVELINCTQQSAIEEALQSVEHSSGQVDATKRMKIFVPLIDTHLSVSKFSQLIQEEARAILQAELGIPIEALDYDSDLDGDDDSGPLY